MSGEAPRKRTVRRELSGAGGVGVATGTDSGTHRYRSIIQQTVKAGRPLRLRMTDSNPDVRNGPLEVAGVCGSLREHSATRIAVRTALGGARAAGATTELVDLRSLDLPPVNPDRPAPPDATAFRQRLRTADAVVLGTPVYHHSYAGVLKNALDYCGFDEFEATRVAVVAVSGGGPGGFPSAAVDHLHGVIVGVRADLHPRPVIVPNASGAVAGGEVRDDALGRRLETLGRELGTAAEPTDRATGKS